MMKRLLLGICAFTASSIIALAQTCPPPGQTASPCFQTQRPVFPEQDCCGAIPLCSEVNFIPNNSILGPGCVNAELPGAGNTCLATNERRTTWYIFEVRPQPGGPTAPGSPAGLLRILIFPNDIPDQLPITDNGAGSIGTLDYDFSLFDITAFGNNRAAACQAIKRAPAATVPGSIQVSCNYNGLSGPTGLIEPGTGNNGGNRYNRPIPVTVGQRFIFAVDNFSNNDFGYKIYFGGLRQDPSLPPSAIVTPPPTDTIRVADFSTPECIDTIFRVKFTRPVLCDSVRPGKFNIRTSDPAINARVNFTRPFQGCNADGQDSVYQFSIRPLIPGLNYTLFVTDTIRDLCGNSVQIDSISFFLPTPDTIRVVGIDGDLPTCGNSVLRLKFSEPVLCDSLTRPSKFRKLLIRSDQFPEGVIPINITRENNLPCGAGIQDSVFVVTFNRAAVDTTLRLILRGPVRNRCGKLVKLDSVAFRINPFLLADATPDTLCEATIFRILAKPDSTFNQTPGRNTWRYTWKNLNEGTLLASGVGQSSFYNYVLGGGNSELTCTPVNLTRPTELNFRVIFQRPYNQCVDSVDVKVLASPKPKPEAISRIALCFGESEQIRPILPSKLDEYDFTWLRQSATKTDTVSLDSIYTIQNDDSLAFYGPSYRYSLFVKYKDVLGGCKADAPINFNVKAGNRVEAAFEYDTTVSVNGFIVPGFFRLVNNTLVFPASDSIRYVLDFKHDKIPGYTVARFTKAPFDTIWSIPGNLTTTLTAFDSVGFGKVCQTRKDFVVELKPFIIPNAVTLNDDGKNDSFKILALPNTFTLAIYNRWGKLVYESGEGSFNEWKPEADQVGIFYYHLVNRRDGKKYTGWFEVMQN